MLIQIGAFLLSTLCGLYAGLLLLRAWAYATGAPMRQPVGEAVMALTDKLVLPLRRVLPKTPRIDWASLLLAWVVALVYAFAMAVVFTAFMGKGSLPLAFLWWAMLVVLRWAVYLLIAVLIVQAVLSFTQPYSPVAGFAQHLTDPMLRPIRAKLPQPGGLDFSPLVLILVAQVLLIVLG